MKSSHSLKAPLAQARGLGSAKDGTHHWVWQRLTAIVIAPLSLWFIISLLSITQNNALYALESWIVNPYHALLSLLLFSALFYHAKLGVQVVIEDYIHCPIMKTILLIINYAVFTIAGIGTILAIGTLHFMV